MKLKDFFSWKHIMEARVESVLGLIIFLLGVHLCIEDTENYTSGSALITIGLGLLPFKFRGNETQNPE